MKSNTRGSLTDSVMQAHKLHGYLLSTYLDGLVIDEGLKHQLRDLFASHKSYRTKYNPVNGHVDLTFMLGWPKAGKLIADFIENCCFSPGPSEEFQLRAAMRNGRTAEETLSYSPFCLFEADIKTEIARTPLAKVASMASPPEEIDDTVICEGSAPDEAAGNDMISVRASRLLRQLTHLAIEPASQTGLSELLKASPLARCKGGARGGPRVMIVMDLNVYGESSSRPWARKCPVNRAIPLKFVQSTLLARTGDSEADAISQGDIFCCIDAGLERRRAFLRPFGKAAAKKKAVRKIIMHFAEKPFIARKKRVKGALRLTQTIYMVANPSTEIQFKEYRSFQGSNQCDLLGPVHLDDPASLPCMHKKDKTAYWGKRKVLAGGPCLDDSDGDIGCKDEDEDDVDDAPPAAGDEDTMVPIAYHMLPPTALADLCEAWGVKHVIDFTPAPNKVICKLVEAGISYFGLCSTEAMRTYLHDQAAKGIEASIADPSSPLYDRRLAGSMDGTEVVDVEAPAPAAKPSGSKSGSTGNKTAAVAGKVSSTGSKASASQAPASQAPASQAPASKASGQEGMDLNELLEAARKQMLSNTGEDGA